MTRERNVTHSPDETARLAQNFAALLSPGDVIALRGELGSGKTTFVQGLARGLGISATVNSPTYMLVNEFAGRIPLYHVDFYRVSSREEVEDLGLEYYFYGEGVTVIEWADRFPEVIPHGATDIRFSSPSEGVREITVQTNGNGSPGD
ncbi:MAG: tRNA (adenosine(37)-N6)-threonylcarbamoyltransferase complex ATPase subunit type 1 TsaE [Candidatus Neomarinimicrobiota bacterium]